MKEVRSLAESFRKDIEDSQVVQIPFSFWLEDYLNWLQTSIHNNSLSPAGRPPSKSDFYLWLFEYLNDLPAGYRHFGNIIFDNDGRVLLSV